MICMLGDWLNACWMIEGRSMWGFIGGMLEMKKEECLEIHEIEGNIWKMIIANAC